MTAYVLQVEVHCNGECGNTILLTPIVYRQYYDQHIVESREIADKAAKQGWMTIPPKRYDYFEDDDRHYCPRCIGERKHVR